MMLDRADVDSFLGPVGSNLPRSGAAAHMHRRKVCILDITSVIAQPCSTGVAIQKSKA